MKGVVFLIVQRALREEEGEDVAQRVLAEAGLAAPFEEGDDYPDAGLVDLLEAAEPRIPGDPAEVRRRLGRSALQELAVEYPSFFQTYTSLEGFLRDLDDVIHPEVRKLFPEAEFPEFHVEDGDEGALTVTYRSQRELCHLAEGLILGTADRYRQEAEVEQPACTHRGDEVCRLRLTLDD